MKLRDELIQNIKSKIAFEKLQIQDTIDTIGLKTYTAKSIENRKKRIVFYEDCIDQIDTLYSSLENLAELAKHDTGGSKVAAQFLLNIYNARYSDFNLRDLSLLDNEYWEDAINVLKLDRINYAEVHEYLKDGKNIFRKMIDDWKTVA